MYLYIYIYNIHEHLERERESERDLQLGDLSLTLLAVLALHRQVLRDPVDPNSHVKTEGQSERVAREILEVTSHVPSTRPYTGLFWLDVVKDVGLYRKRFGLVWGFRFSRFMSATDLAVLALNR